MESLELVNMPQDMTLDEKKTVQDFIANGCPGIIRIQQSDVFKWFNLYMSGKTYGEIATIEKHKKDVILYFAYKSNWLNLRLKHYEDINLNILEKIKQAKLESANIVTNFISAWGKYIDQKSNRFLSTNDSSIIEDTDGKIVAQYFKAMEVLEKLVNPDEDPDTKKNPGQSALVNINMGSNATMKQVGDGSIEITDETAGELLKSLASMKKSHEDKK